MQNRIVLLCAILMANFSYSMVRIHIPEKLDQLLKYAPKNELDNDSSMYDFTDASLQTHPTFAEVHNLPTQDEKNKHLAKLLGQDYYGMRRTINYAIAAAILAGADPNIELPIKYSEFGNRLLRCVMGNDSAYITFLLEHDANPNLTINRYAEVPLHRVASRAMAELLVKHKGAFSALHKNLIDQCMYFLLPSRDGSISREQLENLADLISYYMSIADKRAQWLMVNAGYPKLCKLANELRYFNDAPDVLTAIVQQFLAAGARGDSMNFDGMQLTALQRAESSIKSEVAYKTFMDLVKPNNESVGDCCICMDPGSNCLTPCSHSFHGRCLYNWFEKQQNCPECRESFIELLEEDVDAMKPCMHIKIPEIAEKSGDGAK